MTFKEKCSKHIEKLSVLLLKLPSVHSPQNRFLRIPFKPVFKSLKISCFVMHIIFVNISNAQTDNFTTSYANWLKLEIYQRRAAPVFKNIWLS